MCARVVVWLVWVLCAFPAALTAQALQGTAFTYQGELVQNGTPVEGSVDLVFELFDAPTGGNPVGSALAFTTANGNPATVSGGIFSVALDFGAAAFAGPVANARWLRVTVNGNVLAPRTKIESAPYALIARNAELAFTVPVASIGAAEIDASEVQRRGTLTACAAGMVVSGIDATGNVTCVADAAGSGDITAVTAGSGLTGGGTSGDVALAVDTSVVQARGTLTQCPVGSVVREITSSGNVVCVGDANSGGDITGVTAGSGLTGGGTSGTVSVAADTNVVQSRVSATCPPESSIRAIDVNGAVTCEGDSFGAAGAGWAISGNAGTTAGANYVGTTDTQPFELRVEGARAMRFEPTAQSAFGGQVNVIGGAAANAVTAGAQAATIAGGGGTAIGANRVTDNTGVVGGGSNNRAGNDNASISDAQSATVAGGSSNVASGDGSTIAGGSNNLASGIQSTVSGGQSNTASALRASVGGGVNNVASGTGAHVSGGNANLASGTNSIVGGGSSNAATVQQAVVTGGSQNVASGFAAAILGGTSNTASGGVATVAGGISNVAGGDFSFAAGRRATVRDVVATGEDPTCANSSSCGDEGTVMFADSNAAAFFSDGPNKFLVRATGGVRFVTAIDGPGNATAGVGLAAGGGAWSSLSDRDAKTDFAAVDPLRLLDAVLRLPITQWRYRAQDASVRHLGPMAQDFRAAFGLGEDERHITTVDADGVALAAIQGLNAKLEGEVAALEATNERLARENARLAREQAALAARLARIEASLRTAEAPR